jgi:hypothetical protein
MEENGQSYFSGAHLGVICGLFSSQLLVTLQGVGNW